MDIRSDERSLTLVLVDERVPTVSRVLTSPRMLVPVDVRPRTVVLLRVSPVTATVGRRFVLITVVLLEGAAVT